MKLTPTDSSKIDSLAIIFCFLTIGGSFGGGGSFQVNQALNAISESVPFFGDHRWVFGLIFAVMVGVVIIGGIKRIAGVAEKIVPLMCGIYLVACLYILLVNAGHIPAAFGKIIGSQTKRAAASIKRAAEVLNLRSLS